jgi:hypothetical protein
MAHLHRESSGRDQGIAYWYQRLTYSPDTGKLTEADIGRDRANYLKLLDECEAALHANPNLASPAHRQGFNFFSAEPPHFLLSYQHRNNVQIFRRLAEVYRQMFPEVCYVAPHVRALKKTGTKPRSHLIRVGFVSGRFSKLSSVMKDRMGVIKLLDRARYSVALFSFAEPKDHFGKMSKEMVDEYYLCDATDFIKTRSLIASASMDVLVYCELGFGPHTYALAHCRLAPVQLTTWGHSDTSGIPTIDHYISTVLYEVDDREEAASHYSENLILHESLCTHYFPPYDEGVKKSMRGRERFFLPARATVYLLIQTPFKIVHRFLVTVANIIKGDPEAILIMTSHPSDHVPGERNYQSLQKLLSDGEIMRVRMFPWMPYIEAQNLIGVSDVLLDSYPFGGCNTSIESLSVGKPVITMPARFLYGRFTYGFYKKMGIMDLVAESYEAYEELALKVGRDAAYRQKISMDILGKASCLFEDDLSVKEWDETVGALAAPNVEIISREEAWLQALQDFHQVCAPYDAFLWKGSLLAFTKGEPQPSFTEPYRLAIETGKFRHELIGALTRKHFRVVRSYRLQLDAKEFIPNQAFTLVLSREKFSFALDIVQSSTPKPQNRKKRGSKAVLEFWSLSQVNGSLLADRWTGATKWKDVEWPCAALKGFPVKSPSHSVVERWLDERYGASAWHHEIQSLESPAHALFNLKAPYVYTFIPAMQGFTKADVKAFLRGISGKGWRLRAYIQESYNPHQVADEVKGKFASLEWVKSIPLSWSAPRCKTMVAHDRRSHPTLRAFAIIPPFMSNAPVLFGPQDFDIFVQV